MYNYPLIAILFAVMITDEAIISKIYLIRGKKVMIDRDLAEMYRVETGQFKRQVKRNIDRFPDDFMFEMSKDELQNWRSQLASPMKIEWACDMLLFAFTEQGVAMLSSVLNSQRAIAVNIHIISVFTKMRQMLLTIETNCRSWNTSRKRL